MNRVDSEFKERVYAVVAQIPRGRVVTYGQVAAMAGAAWAAWEVGQIAHTGPSDLPWQRVVNKSGGLARGYPGGLEGHKQAIEADGVDVSEDYKVNISQLLWQPVPPNQSSLL
ncbi:MAG TPA: MGMT family protein [Candidatus Saccharimonadales bacterium]|nr:MGMT family protein [Candidatus Saccharimonadales bacterium]